MEKSAVLAPMPTAIVITATSVNCGLFHRARIAAWTSDMMSAADRATAVPERIRRKTRSGGRRPDRMRNEASQNRPPAQASVRHGKRCARQRRPPHERETARVGFHVDETPRQLLDAERQRLDLHR